MNTALSPPMPKPIPVHQILKSPCSQHLWETLGNYVPSPKVQFHMGRQTSTEIIKILPPFAVTGYKYALFKTTHAREIQKLDV